MGSASHLGVVRRFGSAALSVERLEARRLLASVVIDFEGLAPGAVEDPYTEASGFRFSHLRSYGAPAGDFFAYGPPEGYASRVIHPFDFGNQFQVDRADGGAFDLLSFDYAASRFGGPGDFVITGTFASGGTQQETVSFSGSKSFSTLDLNWTDLTQVRISYAGGLNHAYGALDNFVLEVEGGDPSVTGSLTQANPVAGPAIVSFDGRSWNEVDALLPLPDGRFYAVGRSGVEAPEATPYFRVERQDPSVVLSYVTRHMPDGSLDTSWGEQGRSDVPADLAGLHAHHLTPQYRRVQPVEDGFLVRKPGGFVKLGTDLGRDMSFGTNGVVPAAALFTALPGGGLATLSGPILRVYDASGQEQASTNVEDLILPLTLRNTARIGGDLASDAAGNIYLGVTNIEGPPYPGDPGLQPFTGVAKFLPSLVLDASYGHLGIARGFGSSIEQERPEALFVSPEGRALLAIAEGDGDRKTGQFTPSGLSLQEGFAEYSASHPPQSDNQSYLWGVSFLEDKGIALAVNHARSHRDSWDTAVFESGFFQSYPFEVEAGDVAVANVIDFEEFEIPRQVNGLFLDDDGTFVVGGFIEDVDFVDVSDGRYVTNVDHHAALWRIDPTAVEQVHIQFSDAPVGLIPSGRYEEGGFVFEDRPGSGGPASEPLVISGVETGYESNVLSTFNWGRRIHITRANGGTFRLNQFAYGVGRFDDAGDFIVTGTFADGSTRSTTLSFRPNPVFRHRNMNVFRPDPRWDNLVSLSINSAGGVNDAYGAIDGLRFIVPVAEQQTVVDMEAAPLGEIPSGVYVEDGFTFSSRPGDRGPVSEPLLVLGPPHGYASNVLQPFNWGRRIDVERSGGGTFSLLGFDYGSNQWSGAGDFILTGTFAGGGTETRTVTFSSKTLTRLDLDWEDLTRVSINFAGGVNEAYGVVDNFVFAG